MNEDAKEEEIEKMIKIYIDKLKDPRDLFNQCV